jgi:membrane carboxypeptidase/penicillin-binding protein
MGITVAVRIGFDDNRLLGSRETGGRTALPIFREIMLRIYKNQLVGPAPHFPAAIEDGIDRYLAMQVAPPQANPTERPGSDSAAWSSPVTTVRGRRAPR